MRVSLYKKNLHRLHLLLHHKKLRYKNCHMTITTVTWQVMLAYNACLMCCSEATNGAEVVARMLEHIARHKGYIPIPVPPEGDIGTANGYTANGPPRGRAVARAGAGRLRDAIVFGYMMQRHRARGKVHSLLTEKKRKTREKSTLPIRVAQKSGLAVYGRSKNAFC